MKNYLVRDNYDLDFFYGVISLESEEQWNKAKEYVKECRKKDGRHFTSDSELIEEYFQINHIKYEWIDFDEEIRL